MSIMALNTSRLLGPAPVLEFTMTLMEDNRVDWQFMNFSGRRWGSQEIRGLLIRLAHALPNDITPAPPGGTPADGAMGGVRSPLPLPSSDALAVPSLPQGA
jgi:hypothetical protein